MKYVSNDTIKNADDEKHENNYLVQRDFNFLNNLKRKLKLQKDEVKQKNKRILQNHASMKNHNNHSNKRSKLDTENDIVIRRGVNCLLVPKGMERSISNKSRWDKSLDVFVWTIEWIICSKSSDIDTSKNSMDDKDSTVEDHSKSLLNTSSSYHQESKHISHKVKENVTLIEGLSNVVYEKCCGIFNIIPIVDNGADIGELENKLNAKDMIRQNKDKARRADLLLKNGLKFYTKWFDPNQINMLKDSRKLVELNPVDISIGELFRDRTVIEFPTIYICKDSKDLPSGFEIIKEETTVRKSIDTVYDYIDGESQNEAPVETKNIKEERYDTPSSEDDYDPTAN